MATGKRRVGLLEFVLGLSRRNRLGVGAVSAVAVLAGALDAAGIALVMPMVEFMIGSNPVAGENQVYDWALSAFNAVGLAFTLKWILIVVLVLTVVRGFALLAQTWLGAHYRARYEAEVKTEAYEAIMGAGWPFFLRQRSGELSNALTGESTRAGNALGFLNGSVGAFLNMVVYLALVVAVSWQLTLVTLGAMVILLLVFSLMVKVAGILGERATQANTDLLSEINEGIGSAKIIKSQALEEPMIRRLSHLAFRRARIDVLLGVNSGMFYSTGELAFIALLIGGILLATRVMNQPATTVMVCALLFFRTFQRTRVFQQGLMGMSANLPGAAAVERITREAREESEPRGGRPFDRLRRGIEFQDVYFTYEQGAPVLRGVSMSVPTGSMVAVVGRSGAGKTSIVDLVIGLLRPTSGSVLVDGEPLESLDRIAWRSKLAYVSQETVLFHESIQRNIVRGRQGATDADARRAASLAEADEFIRSLPAGYETIIGDRGMRLSGGQRQRLALARALIRSPELLILDEATSELDTEAEARIQASLDRLRGKVTVLVVAHRLSTVTSADLIHVLSEGRIAESGTMRELLSVEGAFHRLYAQSGGGEIEEAARRPPTEAPVERWGEA